MAVFSVTLGSIFNMAMKTTNRTYAKKVINVKRSQGGEAKCRLHIMTLKTVPGEV